MSLPVVAADSIENLEAAPDDAVVAEGTDHPVAGVGTRDIVDIVDVAVAGMDAGRAGEHHMADAKKRCT